MTQKTVVPENLGATLRPHAITPNKYDVNVDGSSLVVDPITGIISVDASSVAVTVVSADAGQQLVAGSDGGALMTTEVFQDLVGDMVVSATDGLTYDDAIGALTSAVASAIGTDSENINMSVSLSGGVLHIKAISIIDPVAGNLLQSSATGLLVDSADVAAAAAAATTNVNTLTSDVSFVTKVNGVSQTTAVVELQDAFGVHLGEIYA